MVLAKMQYDMFKRTLELLRTSCSTAPATVIQQILTGDADRPDVEKTWRSHPLEVSPYPKLIPAETKTQVCARPLSARQYETLSFVPETK